MEGGSPLGDDDIVTGALDLPDLNKLAYSNDDDDDHAGGGHCVSLPNDGIDQWEFLLGQHLQALKELVGCARKIRDSGDDGGWALTRPVLFAAHHTCEMVIKLALVKVGAKPPPRHDLHCLMQRLDVNGGTSHLSAESSAWVDDLLGWMKALTGGSGFDGRYPNGRSDDVAQQWCCVNIDLLAEAVEDLVGLLVAKADTASDGS